MRVRELRLLLKMMPDDALVLVAGGGPGLFHVDAVTRRKSFRRHSGFPPPVCEGESIELSASRYRTPLWFQAEPDFEMSRRWPLSKLPPTERAELLGEYEQVTEL